LKGYFGIYLTIIGLIIVFAILSIVALANFLMNKFFSISLKIGNSRDDKLKKVAAVAAVYMFSQDEIKPSSIRIVSKRKSRWLTVARMEGLKFRGESKN